MKHLFTLSLLVINKGSLICCWEMTDSSGCDLDARDARKGVQSRMLMLAGIAAEVPYTAPNHQLLRRRRHRESLFFL